MIMLIHYSFTLCPPQLAVVLTGFQTHVAARDVSECPMAVKVFGNINTHFKVEGCFCRLFFTIFIFIYRLL